jgi:Arc/MetJ-type ribon-helix-helix transcriptional regulator
MRSVINISLPQQLSWAVDKEIKKGAYATRSEFFRYLLRLWFEGKMLKELESSREELQDNKGKLLKSLKDLR